MVCVRVTCVMIEAGLGFEESWQWKQDKVDFDPFKREQGATSGRCLDSWPQVFVAWNRFSFQVFDSLLCTLFLCTPLAATSASSSRVPQFWPPWNNLIGYFVDNIFQ
ncbi:hypothetical protein VNO80_19616 [Phaseolus coccineus]|uniref:Uncharacterized protein n=1 Tax=Phaseolus coccineus TaxID=3886 RepID=A0AAN9MMJ9_PHACN